MLRIASRLEEEGFETWCVGGAVRDALLGHPHLDWDLATAARPEQVRKLFRRTVPVGIEFGTVGVLDDQGIMHEVTTFRRDVQTDGRHAVVEFGASLDEDLARRDFTINAIAYSSSSGRLHDPFGGRRDLADGIVRAVGSPEQRMREDRLRALRGIRFASRFGFEIESVTWQAIVESAPSLSRLSAERVKQEIEKTLDQVERPSIALELWRRSGAIDVLVPALSAVTAVTLGSLDSLPRPGPATRPARRINRLVALFADVSPKDASRVLRALRFANAEIRWVSEVLEGWRAIGPSVERLLLAASGGSRSEKGIDDTQIRRWVAAVGRTRLAPVLRLIAARASAGRRLGHDAPSPSDVASLYRRAVRIAFRDAVALGDLAVDGDDLRAAGVPDGPLLGRILALLLQRVVDDPSVNSYDTLVRIGVALHDELRER
ncbi:MAG: CCA tRNA nucleotidyltransferase [Gemmatimonadota bacterium]|nr:CCA tRNA nucleotidyltransferase [Gemmatimonadota bacterium]